MLPIRNKCDLQILTVRSPAKLIISGEHAVLYGKPALAVAIDRYITTTVSYINSEQINFNFADFAYCKSYASSQLKNLAASLRHSYNEYLAGNGSIANVLQQPVELLQYTVATVLAQLTGETPHGLEIKVNSAIPVGCGMGSSAAAVLSVVYALNNLLQIKLPNYIEFARNIENLQHGRSSGLDLHLVAQGGYVKFQDGIVLPQELPQLKLQIINTGKPATSTGECVAKVANFFTADPSLANEFAAITEQIYVAINKQDFAAIKTYVKQNQQLLEHIGVVPTKVKNLLRDIEAAGGAAKVCGAGAVHGTNAGVILLISEYDLHEVVHQHGYKIEDLQIDTRGTQIV